MAIKVKDATASATKFQTNASLAGQSYTNGVAAAGPTWQAQTVAAASTWQQGVTEAAANGRFAAGINNASQQKYTNRVAAVGSQRYTSGVQTAGPAWQNGAAPYLQTIAGLTLPARQPKGSPANLQRVQVVTAALRAKKTGQSS